MTNDVKIVVCGDIHLRLRGNINQWLKSRFIALAMEVVKASPNILILNGDIFDKASINFQELSAFYKFIDIISTKLPKCAIYVIDGNHEELTKTTTTFDYLPEYNFTHYKNSTLQIKDYILYLYGHPYINEILSLNTVYEKSILISHYRSVLKFATEEIDNEKVSKNFIFTILSDIHYPYAPKDNILYTSSPYSTAFLKDTQFGFIELTITDDDFKVYFNKLDLPCLKLLELAVEEVEEVLYSLDSKHLYKIRVFGDEDTMLVDLLVKHPSVVQYSFVPDEEVEYKNIQKIKDLIEDTDSQIGVNFVDLIESSLPDNLKTEIHLKLGRKFIEGLV